MSPRDPRAVVEAVWRLESGRIVAGVARLVRDVGLAEDLAQDALVAALDEWPRRGVPPNPGAWLMLTARHRAIDRLRRDDRLADNLRLIGQDLRTRASDDAFAGVDEVPTDGVDASSWINAFSSTLDASSNCANAALTRSSNASAQRARS